MTCIVGINTGKKIIIAGDNRGSDSFRYMQDKKPKVFKKKDFIFGVCGSYRVMQLLEYKLQIPKRNIGQTTDNYIYTSFVDAVFNLLDKNNALQLKDGLKSFSGNFLFGYENELYILWQNFQINVNNKNYNVAGSGSYHATASLYSTEGLNITPKERLRRAIVCASEFVISVDSKIDFVELKYDKIPKKESKPKRKYTKKKTKRK